MNWITPQSMISDHTLVDLTWRERRIEHRIRFGRITEDQRLDRHRRVVAFAPSSIFAFVRWEVGS